jgi:hypothetical protein
MLVQQIRFVDLTTLAFGEPGALEVLRVDRLDYDRFHGAPAAQN